MSFHFKIKERLGKGSYSFVYGGLDELGNDVAIKKERFEAVKTLSIQWEYEVMTASCENEQRKNRPLPPIPYPLMYGMYKGMRCLVMPKLGDSVGELQLRARFCRFSYATTFKVAYFMIKALQATHNAGYVHADLKPENMLSGPITNRGKVFLADFGLSKSFKKENSKFITECFDAMIGTVAFTSAKALKRLSPGPREDLESLGYVLIYILTHNLPWTERYSKGVYLSQADVEMRKLERRTELCKGVTVLKQYFDLVDVIRWGDMPDYENMTNLFANALQKMKSSIHEPIDWSGPTDERNGYLKNQKNTSRPYQEELYGSSNEEDQWGDEHYDHLKKDGITLKPEEA